MSVLQRQMQKNSLQNYRCFSNWFICSEFVVKAGLSVWADYALEVTQNKALKGKGGIIGLTLRGNALARYFLSRPVTAQYSMTFHSSIQTSTSNTSKSPHQQDASKKHWVSSVEKMNNLFETSVVDPFKLSNPPEHLINIASGVVAPTDIEHSMLNYIKTGKILAEQFTAERLCHSSDGNIGKSFYDPVKRSGVKTMSELKVKVTGKNRSISLDREVTYLRLMAINAKKKLPLDRVMSFENSTVPLRLFNEDGSMRLPNSKSDFMTKLEQLNQQPLPPLESQQADCLIVDGHFVIQLLLFLPRYHLSSNGCKVLSVCFKLK